jgi:hypothetical protein
MYFNRERNTAQTSTPTTFVSRSAPQAHPIFLLKPIQYPTPNNPRFNHPATVIRPILSSNINGPVRFFYLIDFTTGNLLFKTRQNKNMRISLV